MLTERAIAVLEFKAGMRQADSASKWQAFEYGLDLRDFHAASAGCAIFPLVVPTGSSVVIAGVPIDASTFVRPVLECSPLSLAAMLTAIASATNRGVGTIELDGQSAGQITMVGFAIGSTRALYTVPSIAK